MVRRGCDDDDDDTEDGDNDVARLMIFSFCLFAMEDGDNDHFDDVFI